MPASYTSGLRVSANTVIRKERRLPTRGEVLVNVGDAVTADTVVARASFPGELITVRAAERLGVEPNELPALMLKPVGETVSQGDLLAQTKGLFGLFKTELRAPISGTLENVSATSGHLGLRLPPRALQTEAYLRGQVVEVRPAEGATIEARGALVQGIFGVGGERRGPLRVAAAGPEAVLEPGRLDDSHRGAVVVGGASATAEAFARARDLGIAALIVGAMTDRQLRDYVGYDIGVTITGEEAVPFTLILTEGFGALAMAARTFRLLADLEGQEASVNGATQIRAGVIRPEIVVPRDGAAAAQEAREPVQELVVGTAVRLIREPHFGRLAAVTALPPELAGIETEARVRVVEVAFENGETVRVPRANVEIIQE